MRVGKDELRAVAKSSDGSDDGFVFPQPAGDSMNPDEALAMAR